MVRKSKTKIDIKELNYTTNELESVLTTKPVADTPSVIVYKDGAEYEIVQKNKLEKFMNQQCGLSAADIERIINRPCHINGWSLKDKE